MKKYILLIYLLTSAIIIQAQVSVNSETYRDGTMVVEPNSRTTPNNKTGILVPRVANLNVTDPKEDGLLVFLDNPTPPLPTGEPNGFYYWDAVQNKWVGWQSMSTANITDKSQFFASGVRFDTSSGTMKDADSPAKIIFNNLDTNNPAICTLSGGAITINKTGWYYIQISVTLKKNSTPTSLRDIIYFQLLHKDNTSGIPGTPPASGDAARPTPSTFFRSFNSFAFTSPSDETFTTYAPIKLNAGDVIQMGATITYRDPGGGNDPIGGIDVGELRVDSEYSITDGTVATLSAKYLGDF
ncbi:hypothetical protein [Dysgonomonas sp. 520]|uniref:hypothetical protein n=1 Tax=Dysgonomonas sp. 520 TaxID=2302931 RepID=UPI0013CF4BAB|nr:hypothetical protein [Dysgonomonas sp. 520]NDW08477.1 hypothetical protein [Dysgonomonas sp. 520]